MPVEHYISLSELTGQIKAVLDNSFFNRTFWVLADVTDHKFYADKNHHYFNLVEKSSERNSVLAKVLTVAWTDGAASIESFERITGQRFRNGINVLVNVSVSYHQAYGLQLKLNDIDTTFTIGQLEQQRQQTIQRLLNECSEFIQKVGERFVTRNNQIALAQVIQNIAVVTSNTAAGFHDFVDTVEKNKFGYKINVEPYFTMVQGEGNVDALHNKLLEIFNSQKKYDAVVIIRGGGSQTDFLIFDQFKLARIAAKFPIPIIAGIGHQINETIVDLMAHTSVKTPSIAAEFIISHNRQFEDEVTLLQKNIIIKSQQLLSHRQREINQVSSTIMNSSRDIIQVNKDVLVDAHQVAVNKSREILFNRSALLNDAAGKLLSKPRIIVSNKLNDLTNAIDNLKSYNRKYLMNQRGYLGHYVSICKLMSPANILKKGFAIVYQDDKIIVDGNAIKPGKKIKVRLEHSEIEATVNTNKKVNGTEFDI